MESRKRSRVVVENLRLFGLSIQTFVGSAFFHILLGCAFLVAADRLTDRSHPSLVFLLAVLGVSIVLFGTGTQGIGSADVPGVVPLKVYIAGGAGVLAAVFGFGILWQAEHVQSIFSKKVNYGLIQLDVKRKQNAGDNLGGSTGIYNLAEARISATTRDSRQLHHIARSGSIEVLVPTALAAKRTYICLSITNSAGNAMLNPNPLCLDLPWRSPEDHDVDDPITHLATGEFSLVDPNPTKLNDRNTPAEQYEFTPQ